MTPAGPKGRLSQRLTVIGALLLLLAASACTAQLAPAYDQSIVDGLVSVNKETQTLFASIGSDAPKETFPSRKDAYISIIGSLNALIIQIKVRPAPSVSLSDVNAALAKVGVAPIASDPKLADVPSARSLADAADTIEHMKAADARNGLHGNAIKAFENQTNIFLSQAIAYESFLKR